MTITAGRYFISLFCFISCFCPLCKGDLIQSSFGGFVRWRCYKIIKCIDLLILTVPRARGQLLNCSALYFYYFLLKITYLWVKNRVWKSKILGWSRICHWIIWLTFYIRHLQNSTIRKAVNIDFVECCGTASKFLLCFAKRLYYKRACIQLGICALAKNRRKKQVSRSIWSNAPYAA